MNGVNNVIGSHEYMDGLVQEILNSSVLARCTNPSIYPSI